MYYISNTFRKGDDVLPTSFKEIETCSAGGIILEVDSQ